MSIVRYGLFDKNTNELLLEHGGPEYLKDSIKESINNQCLRTSSMMNIECEVRPLRTEANVREN